jgi:hypothetical protein
MKPRLFFSGLLLWQLCAFQAVAQTNPCVPPPPGLTAWWPFDEVQGRVAQDIGGTVNNAGIYTGKPFPSVGKVGTALCFSQVGDSVVVTNQAEVEFQGICTNGAESFTIDAWIKPVTNGPSFQPLLDKRTPIAFTHEIPPLGYCLALTEGVLTLDLADGATSIHSAGPDLRDSRWHFVAVTVIRCLNSSNLVTFFVDGQALPQVPDPRAGDLSSGVNLVIGATASPTLGPNNYVGCFDELEIYKRALSTNDLEAIFAAGAAGKCKCAGQLTIACTNITIPCGAPIPTNPPAVLSSCCSNITFTLISSTTNFNSNPPGISLLWQAMDCSSNIASCTQIVTIGFASNYVDPGGLLPGFESAFLPPSSNNVSISVPTCFGFCFCGTFYTNVWINNDGTVSLDGPFGGQAPERFTPATPMCQLNRKLFAPFWSHVDTQPPSVGTVGWGCSCAFVPGIGARPAFGITWRGVGYFGGHADKSNSFQLLIIDRSDRSSGGFDLQFRYAGLQWDTARSCFGLGGLCDFGGGIPARAGYAGGTNCCAELPGSGFCGRLLDNGVNSLVTGHSTAYPNGVYILQVTNCFTAGGF